MPTVPGRFARNACYGSRGHRPRRLRLARSRRRRRDGGCRQSNGLARLIDNLWHPCRAPQFRPARHGHGRHDVAIPGRAPDARMHRDARRGKGVSHQPLQPISFHEHPGEPTLPSTGLAPCRPPLPGPPLFTGLLRRRGNDPFRTRRRRTTTRAVRPRVAPRLAPLAPAGARVQPAAARTVARTVGSARRSSRSACSALHEVADQTPDAPCRAVLPTRPSMAERAFDGAKNPFHRRQANAAAFRARSVFYRRVSHATLPCWRAGECVEPPRIHRLCHRRSASDTHSPACRRLGPNA